MIKSVEMRRGNELDQISIASLVFRQEGQMKYRIPSECFILVRTGGDIGFAADNGLYASRHRALIKIDRAEEVAVIGHRNCRHLHFDSLFHQLSNPDGTIEEGVFGVQVEMNEGVAGHPFSI